MQSFVGSVHNEHNLAERYRNLRTGGVANSFIFFFFQVLYLYFIILKDHQEYINFILQLDHILTPTLKVVYSLRAKTVLTEFLFHLFIHSFFSQISMEFLIHAKYCAEFHLGPKKF